tara:strand:+ start:354 stop:674 length:321 start_codon:yes stop_codon:yes gene_type:complete
MAKRGRPPVSDSKKKKHFIGFNMDDATLNAFNSHIEKDGSKHKRSEYIRKLIMAGIKAGSNTIEVKKSPVHPTPEFEVVDVVEMESDVLYDSFLDDDDFSVNERLY